MTPTDAHPPIDPPKGPPVDSGLASFTLVLRVLGIAVSADQLAHQLDLGRRTMRAEDMLRVAPQFGLRARLITTAGERLERTPLPAIALGRDGRAFVLAKVGDGKALIQDPTQPRPATVSLDQLAQMWDGRLVLLARRASLGELARRFDISWFLGAIHKYRWILGEVLAASFFLQLFALITPLFFQVVIDKVLVHRGLSTLDVLILGLIVISVFEVVLGGLRTFVFSHTTNRIDVELGARLYRHLMALPIAYFEARRVGDSVARVRELETVRSFITGSAVTVAIDLVFTVVFIAVMFYYSAILSWIVVGAFPFYIALSVVVTPMFRRRLDEKFRRGAENQAFLVESVTGVETVKAMAVEPQMQRRWDEQLAAYVRASFASANLGNVASQAAALINKLTIALTLFFGARLAIEGALTVGELVAFNMLATRVNSPVLRLAQLWQDFQQVSISVDRLGDILNTHPETSRGAAQGSLPPIKGDITLEGVVFRYRHDGQPVLRDVSLAVPAGQVVGIVGPSGSGKSTLAKLVQRLYVPETGRVMVDGVDLALADAGWLRRQIGVVLQDNVLFNRSVRENIALADPAMPLEAVIAAAELAGAHEFITQLLYGYDTPIGERGTTLSGGQRQRIAIARALVTNPRILIFDEATSALDYESEQVIQTNMRRICAGRTVLIIAHRLSAVRFADRIVTIEAGAITEDGSHDELIRRGGRYAKLHRLQMASS
ncbi:MAG: type I secretion system permease/ATPase [Alphaproteobacteria bacterium]|nr:type I secretion system permease/ATPase [Alphaproteobacteria bacterium]